MKTYTLTVCKGKFVAFQNDNRVIRIFSEQDNFYFTDEDIFDTFNHEFEESDSLDMVTQ